MGIIKQFEIPTIQYNNVLVGRKKTVPIIVKSSVVHKQVGSGIMSRSELLHPGQPARAALAGHRVASRNMIYLSVEYKLA